jgi:hypothetical protein
MGRPLLVLFRPGHLTDKQSSPVTIAKEVGMGNPAEKTIVHRAAMFFT